MTTTKIDGIEITMVDNWNEVTLEQFLDFLNWSNLKPDEFEYDYEELIYSLELISIFTSPRITKEEMDSIKISNINKLCESYINFSREIPLFDMKDSIIIDGIQYGFSDIENLPSGEYISYHTLLEKSDNKIKSIPDILSIICRPVISKNYDVELKKDRYKLEEFDITKIKFRRELMLKVPAAEVIGNVYFFLTGNQISTDDFQHSGNLNQEATEI